MPEASDQGRTPQEIVDLVEAVHCHARALVFPGVEDFGITPLEAQACGRPVIAFAAGGALETVTAKTGVFFHEQTVDSMLTALAEFDAFEAGFEPADARAQAQRFSKERFQQALISELSLAISAR